MSAALPGPRNVAGRGLSTAGAVDAAKEDALYTTFGENCTFYVITGKFI